MDQGAVVDTLFEALANGDMIAARACLTPDARVWHSFDRIEQDVDAAVKGWEDFVTAFAERRFTDVRRQAIVGGFVQQQTMVVRAGERRMAWPICLIVRVEAGRIARLEEYMDRAGHFAPDAIEQPL